MCWRILQILPLFLFPLIRAVVTNRTIDDTLGDLLTGAQPTYLPGPWNRPDKCTNCVIRPVLDNVMQRTYSSVTWHVTYNITPVSVGFSFQGTAVYVYFVLANSVKGGATQTACDFHLDGNYISSFHHIPTSSTDFNYNSLVFSKDNLSNENHTLLISSSGFDEPLWLCFDYATYTFDDTLTQIPPPTTTPTPSSNPHPAQIGVIVGGAVGGVLVLGLIVFIFLYLHRIRHRSFPWSRVGNADRTSTTGGFQPFPLTQGMLIEPQNAVSRPKGQTLPPAYSNGVTESNYETSSTSIVTMRQAEIEDRIRGLTREMQGLAGEKNTSTKRPLHIPPLLTYHRSHQRTYTDQIQRQMDTMRGEIEYLRAQFHSDWARGLTDNPPPNYHA